jgi:hypothetical protein
MDLNLKRFLAIYGILILMPEILMGSNHCTALLLSISKKIIFVRQSECMFLFPLNSLPTKKPKRGSVFFNKAFGARKHRSKTA